MTSTSRASPPKARTAPGPSKLAEIFADPMFADFGIPRYELLEVADNAPSIADAVSRLYAAFTEMRRSRRRRRPPGRRGARGALTPASWVRDFIQAQRNHFPYLEEAAETLAGALGDRLAIAGRCGGAQGGVRGRGAGRAARGARRRQPALRPAPQAADAVVAAARREPHLRSPTRSPCWSSGRCCCGCSTRRRRPTRRPGASCT